MTKSDLSKEENQTYLLRLYMQFNSVLKYGVLFFGLLSLWAVAQITRQDYNGAMIEVLDQAPEEPTDDVIKSPAEWAKELSEIEYHVLREAGTEPPNGTIYKQFKAQGEGVYFCAACGSKLFTSKEKFDSGSGWPSFYDAATPESLDLDVDYHIGYKRVEIKCAKCGSHLGHVFEGEGHDTPTDKRYCVNGVCLSFLPTGEE